MRMWSLFVLGLAVLAVIPVVAGEDDACDMKNVEKARYCENDECVLDKSELVSKQKYYVCESCDITSAKKGSCPDCDEPMVEKISGENACKHCLGPTIEIEVCVKKCWMCPECELLLPKAGKCPDCEVALKELVSRVPIAYECAECGMTSFKPGKCTTDDCDAKGKPLAKKCSSSGVYPHGGSPD